MPICNRMLLGFWAIQSLSLSLWGNRELADDLFQETWVRVLERGRSIRRQHEFSAWLYAEARNLPLDYRRKKSPRSLNGLMENEEPPNFLGGPGP
jgi:RNA polymerase sigma-70 factor (ECF subfamily)